MTFTSKWNDKNFNILEKLKIDSATAEKAYEISFDEYVGDES